MKLEEASRYCEVIQMPLLCVMEGVRCVGGVNDLLARRLYGFSSTTPFSDDPDIPSEGVS